MLPPGQKLSGLPLIGAFSGNTILNAIKVALKSSKDSFQEIGFDKEAHEKRKKDLEDRAKELRKGR